MRLRTLSVRGVRPHYRGEVRLDLTRLRGPIVAIVGPNGAGKSVLLGSLFAALYREWPGGGSLSDLALGRDTFVRAQIDTARGSFTITQLGDVVSGKGESSVIDASGEAVLTSGKVTEFDAWAARVLPPARLLLASTFGAQGRAGLLDPDLTPQDRRLVLFRALGLDRYEPLPERFRKRAADARQRADVVSAQIDAERPRAATGDAEAAALAAVAARTAAAEAVDAARQRVTAAQARHEGLLAAWRDAQAARERHERVQAAVRECQERLDGLRARRAEVEKVVADTEVVHAARADAERLARELEGDEARLGSDRLAAQSVRAELDATLSRASSAAARASAGDPARAALREVEERQLRTRAALVDADQVVAGQERVRALDAEIPTAETALDAARRRAGETREASAAADRDVNDAARRVAAAERAVADGEAATRELAAARQATRTVEDLRTKVADAEAAARRAESEIEALTGATLDVAGRRIGLLRTALGSIAQGDGPEAPDEQARAALSVDDSTAREAAEAPTKLQALRRMLDLARGVVVDSRREMASAEALGARLPEMERALERLDAARAELAVAGEAKRTAVDGAARVRADRDAAEAANAKALARLMALRDERAAQAKVADRAGEIAALRALAGELDAQRDAAAAAVRVAEADEARAREDRRVAEAEADRLRADLDARRDQLAVGEAAVLAKRAACAAARRTAERAPEIAAATATALELDAQIATADAAAAAAQAALEAAPLPPDAEPVPDVAAEENAAHAAAEALRQADAAAAVAERALAEARAAADRVRALEAQLDELLREVADWTRLESDTKAVLQLSIDAAGPELAELTNSLLRGGFGDRYTVTVETQRLSADGKRQIEDCFVQIVDTTNGYSGPASGLSGGQVVIVGTALRCALARIGARTAGIERPTIVCDESGAALEEHLVPAWVAMLRHAAQVVGAEHILVVTHNPAVRELADAVVQVRDGRIEVEA